MKVENSAILMATEHNVREYYHREESLRFWTGTDQTGSQGTGTEINGDNHQDVLDISEVGRQLQQQGVGGVEEAGKEEEVAYTIGEKDKQKIMLLQRLLKALTGKDYKFTVPKKIIIKGNQAQIQTNRKNIKVDLAAPAGWGMAWDLEETHSEQEKMSFRAEGTIATAEGEKIDFAVQLTMSREFSSQMSVHLRTGDAAKTDPLVVNFDGSIPGLTMQKFDFDLNADGQMDKISFILPGSGFLALDLDSDGKVDDGRELFGPRSGNGFTELARYDVDSNNWIDENDPAFQDLRIWTKNQDGSDQLTALWEKGVGAIYLGNINAEFDFKNSGDNSLLGQVRTAGIYLTDKGDAGTLQQIDLTV
ncbi:MAG: hypothetical protein ACYCX4_09105 [Bacillota bacterium]